jgi:hypothetical protein
MEENQIGMPASSSSCKLSSSLQSCHDRLSSYDSLASGNLPRVSKEYPPNALERKGTGSARSTFPPTSREEDRGGRHPISPQSTGLESLAEMLAALFSGMVLQPAIDSVPGGGAE